MTCFRSQPAGLSRDQGLGLPGSPGRLTGAVIRKGTEPVVLVCSRAPNAAVFAVSVPPFQALGPGEKKEKRGKELVFLSQQELLTRVQT